MHFAASQLTHPLVTAHCLHYFKVASKYQPALQPVQATFVASQAEHPFVPSRHL